MVSIATNFILLEIQLKPNVSYQINVKNIELICVHICYVHGACSGPLQKKCTHDHYSVMKVCYFDNNLVICNTFLQPAVNQIIHFMGATNPAD